MKKAKKIDNKKIPCYGCRKNPRRKESIFCRRTCLEDFTNKFLEIEYCEIHEIFIEKWKGDEKCIKCWEEAVD